MATLQIRKGSARILFFYRGKRYTFTLGEVAEDEAQAKVKQVDYQLMRIKQGFLTVPAGVSIATFLKHDGQPPQEDSGVPNGVPEIEDGDLPDTPEPEQLTLAALRDDYMRTHSSALEDSTLEGIRIHFRHLVATFGEDFHLSGLSLAQLQQHADRRARMRGSKGKLSSTTIRKELVTLRCAWNWGLEMGRLVNRFPSIKKVRLEKPDEKPPFQTYEEVTRRIDLGGLSKEQIDDLWDCLYLTREEIDDLLKHVQEVALQPWVYPMFCFAAHTGARRSELLRIQVADVDLENKTTIIREKKRAHDKRTTRRVPITPFLAKILKDWLAEHPGGQNLFVQGTKVARSRTKRTAPTPVTINEAHNHFKRTLRSSKWKVIKGWHIFRHSFISLCASSGVDQRLIDEWVGHQTEDQRRRYRHLLPSTQQQAIRSVFGDSPSQSPG